MKADDFNKLSENPVVADSAGHLLHHPLDALAQVPLFARQPASAGILLGGSHCTLSGSPIELRGWPYLTGRGVVGGRDLLNELGR